MFLFWVVDYVSRIIIILLLLKSALGSHCRAVRPVVNPGALDGICHPGPS